MENLGEEFTDVRQAELLEVSVTGSGEPVTLVVHGWGGSAETMRPLLAEVPGTRVSVDLEGHGRTPRRRPEWTYADHAGDLAAVLRTSGATHAIGQSMGAGTLLRLLATPAGRALERVALLLPPAPATPLRRSQVALRTLLCEAIGAQDVETATRVLRACLDPATLAQPQASRYVALSARALVTARPAVQAAGDHPWLGMAVAPSWAGALLVLAQEGDAFHDAADATEVAMAFAGAELEVAAADRPMWRHGASLRSRLGQWSRT